MQSVSKSARRPTKKERVRAYAAAQGWTGIGEVEWRQIRAALPDVSDAAIRASGLEIEQPWSGVRQHTLDQLEQCLRELAGIYETRADLRQYCRKEVIAAKDRARWAAKNRRIDRSRRAMKSEMVDWMLVWLGDPAMFSPWAAARRKQMAGGEESARPESG